MPNNVKVCIKFVDSAFEICDIADDARVFRDIIGGHFSGYHLSSFHSGFAGQPLMVLCHDEGKLIGLPINFFIGAEPIVGNALIVRYDACGDTVDLTPADEFKLRKYLI